MIHPLSVTPTPHPVGVEPNLKSALLFGVEEQAQSSDGQDALK